MRKLFLVLLWMAPPAWAEGWTVEDGAELRIAQDAGNTIKNESWTADVTPRMQFTCAAGGEVVASIDWRRFISSFSTEVGFKVDGGKFTWLKWKVDSSEKVTISPSANDTSRLLDMMRTGDTLTVEITPYSEGPVEVQYALAGFAEALNSLQAHCQ